MKRIFSLFASAVLAASLLALPCFAAAPGSPDEPLPNQSGPVQPDGSEPDGPNLPGGPDTPGGTDGSGAQPCDAFPGGGEVG